MPLRLNDTVTATSAGVVNPGELAKWPEYGGTAQVSLSAGSAVVKLRAWVEPGKPETLATFSLPVAAPDDPEKNGDLYASVPVFSTWRDFDWEVVSISGGGTLTMSLTGVGL